MTQDLILENKVVLAGVQALIGAVTPAVSAISVHVDGEAGIARVFAALASRDSVTLELLDDVVFDVGALIEDAVRVELEVWVGDDWTESWPGRDQRMLYAAHRA